MTAPRWIFCALFLNFSIFFVSSIGTVQLHLNSNEEVIKIGCVDSWLNQNTSLVAADEENKYDDGYTHLSCARKCLQKGEQYQLSFLKGASCQCAPISGFDSYPQAASSCNVHCPVKDSRSDDDDLLPENPCGGNRRYSVYCTALPGSDDCARLKMAAVTSTDNDTRKMEPSGRGQLRGIPVIEEECAVCHTTSHQCLGTSLSAAFDYFPLISSQDCVDFCDLELTYVFKPGSDVISTRRRTPFSILVWWTEPGSSVPLSVCYCAEWTGQRERFQEEASSTCTVPCPGEPSEICGKMQTGREGSIYATVYCIEDSSSSNRCLGRPSPSTTTSTTTTSTVKPPVTHPITDGTTTTGVTPSSTSGASTTTDGHEEPITTSVATTTTTTDTPATSSTPIPIPTCTLLCQARDRHGHQWRVCNGTEGSVRCSELNRNATGMASWRCNAEGHFETRRPDVSQCNSRWLREKHEEVEEIEDVDSASRFIQDLAEACGQRSSSPEKTYFGHEIRNVTKLVNEALCKVRQRYSNWNESSAHWSHEFPSLVESGLALDACLIQYREPWRDLTLQGKSSVSTSLLENMEEKLFQLTTTFRREHHNNESQSGGMRWTFTPKPEFTPDLHQGTYQFLIMAELFSGAEKGQASYAFPSLEHSQKFGTGSSIKLPPGWRNLIPNSEAELGAMSIKSELVEYIMPGQYHFREPGPVFDEMKQPERDLDLKILNGRLISATFGTSTSTNGSVPSDRFQIYLPAGVEITFQHDMEAWGNRVMGIRRKLHPGERQTAVKGSAQCVFWDMKTNTWSNVGCRLSSTSRQKTICECRHLTSFAVLMDLHKYLGKDPGLELLTLILCPLSTIALILTIILLLPVKCGTQRMRATISKNLAFCLLLGNGLVLLVLDRNYFHMGEHVCMCAGMVTHYVFLCAFMWMLIEGIHLYRMVECVFNLGRSYTKQFFISAYLFPAIVVGVTSAMGYLLGGRPYGTDIFCWLEGPYIWAFMAPVAVITLVNLVILFIALKTGYRLQNQQQHQRPPTPSGLLLREQIRSYKSWLMGCFSLTVSLGLTWTFGFGAGLMTGSNGLISSYIFTILNASQGLFLLFFTWRVFPENRKCFAERLLPSWLLRSSIGGGTTSTEQFIDGKKL